MGLEALSRMDSFTQHPLTEYQLHFRFALFQGCTHTVWWGRHGNVSEPGGQRQVGKVWGWARGRTDCSLSSGLWALQALLAAGLCCCCPLPPSTPRHCLSCSTHVHLLAKGSAPGTWTHSPAAPGVEATAWAPETFGCSDPQLGACLLVIASLCLQPKAVC